MELDFGTHRVHVNGMLEQILQQTTKTNGSVAEAFRKIEAGKEKQTKDHDAHHEELHKLNMWKSRLGGVWAAVMVAGTILGGAITLVITYFAEK
jgi:hypothetical protein